MAAFAPITNPPHTTSYQAISPSRPELHLKGKVVLITGGGSGIGARTAQSFAEAGAAHVAVLGRRQVNLEVTAAGVRALFPATAIHTYSVDITDKNAVNDAFEDYVKIAGKIDVLVSNAAAGNIDPPIKDVNVEDWFSRVETNIKGPLLLTQAFLSGYGKEDGLIINVSSAISFLMGPGFSAYAVSKEAGVRFFQIVGMENPKLRIMHVQPGMVETDMNKRSGIPARDDGKIPSHVLF
jgi:NAD(P)-dependent dehydrogenase (short-subunit alcohol dehydrogenase family)